MPKDFLSISRQECLNSYPELLDNAERHYRVGKQLGDSCEFGIGISHHVLGSEELVKAMIIYFDGIGLKIRTVKGVKKFFRDHKSRHFISAIFVILTTVIRPMMQIAERFRQLLHFPDKRENMNEFESSILQNNKEKTEQITKTWGETEGKELAEKMSLSFDFWDEADDYKMRGFYVDYKDKLLSPNQITKEEYDLALDAVNLFKSECLSLIEYCKNLSDNDRTQLVDAVNKDKNIYGTIAQMIEGMNKKTNKTDIY